MKTTYQHQNLRYYYDGKAFGWVVYQVDEEGQQTETAEYYPNKTILKLHYPEFNFEKERPRIKNIPPGTFIKDGGKFLVRLSNGTYTRTTCENTAKELTA